MEVLKKIKKICLLLFLSLLFISCDNVISLSLDSEFIEIDYVKCKDSKKIIVKTNKYCDIDLRSYIKVVYENENGMDQYIKVTKCNELNMRCTKFELNLKNELKPGTKYIVYADHQNLICYFEFVYTE